MDRSAPPSSPPPYKPRPRYGVTLRRLDLWSALLAVAGLLRLAWGWKAEREWRAAVERCRAEGLPLAIAEWPPGPPEREPNAVRMLDAADRTVRAPGPDDAPWLDDPVEYSGPRVRAERIEAAAWFVAENPDVYAALEGLHGLSADWAGWVRASGLSRASEVADAANLPHGTNGFDAVRSVRIAAFVALGRSDLSDPHCSGNRRRLPRRLPRPSRRRCCRCRSRRRRPRPPARSGPATRGGRRRRPTRRG